MIQRTSLLLAVALLSSPALAKKPSKGEREAATLEARIARLEAAMRQRPRDVSDYRLPQTIDFCGEKFDTTAPRVRERFERELLLILGRRHQVVLWARRAHGVFPVVEAEAKRLGACADLKYVAVIESGLRPAATSRASAKGWWQFMSGTGAQYGLDVSRDWDQRGDLVASSRAGLTYLRALREQFGSWPLALAAYNTGPGRVKRVIKQQGTDDFWRLDLYTEAERYVPRTLAIKAVLDDLPRYGFHLDASDGWSLDARGYVKTRIPKGRKVGVLAAARGSGIDYRDLRELNPELGADLLPTGREVVLEVPAGKERALRGWLAKELARAPAPRTARKAKKRKSKRTARKSKKRKSKRSYTIQSGDSLWSIAQQQKVTIGDLRRWNRLGRRSILKPGQKLRLRPAR